MTSGLSSHTLPMTPVALPMTGETSPVTGGARTSPGEPGFALYVGLPGGGVAGRALLAEVAEAVTRLVAEMAPEARTHSALDLGGRSSRGDVVTGLREALEDQPRTAGPAARRAEAAWRAAQPDRRVVLDMSARELTVGSVPIPLTFTELALLEYLLRAPHRAVTRQELLANVWRAGGPGIGTRTIDVHVRRLREKLGGCLQIVTVRGVGYRCDSTPEIVLVGSGDAG